MRSNRCRGGVGGGGYGGGSFLLVNRKPTYKLSNNQLLLFYIGNWSMMKRSILIGSLSGTDRFNDTLKKHFPFMSGGQFWLNFYRESGLNE